MRGAPRKVRFRSYFTYEEAQQAAIEANRNLALIKHRHSVYRQTRIDEGFVRASDLPRLGKK